MRKSYIDKVSKKQAVKNANHIELKAALIRELGAVCMTCGTRPAFPPISLSHIVALSRGGKTDRSNVILEDIVCHSRYEKKPETRPTDSIGYKLWLAQKGLE